MEQIFNNFGITIFKRDNKYFMQYDNGEIVSTMKEIELTETEAIEIREQKDATSVYDYMIKNLNDRV